MGVELMINCRDGEEIIHVVRRHPAAMSAEFFGIFCIVALPFFFVMPLLAWRPYGPFVLLFAVLIGLFIAIRTIVQWYYTMFVVTSLRIVDISQVGFLDRQVTDAGYEVIQDVSYRKSGLKAMMLNMGTITVQTAGSSTMIEVPDVEKPEVVLGMINDARRSLSFANPLDPKKKFVKALESLSNDDMREVLKIAEEKKRKRAGEKFFEESENEE